MARRTFGVVYQISTHPGIKASPPSRPPTSTRCPGQLAWLLMLWQSARFPACATRRSTLSRSTQLWPTMRQPRNPSALAEVSCGRRSIATRTGSRHRCTSRHEAPLARTVSRPTEVSTQISTRTGPQAGPGNATSLAGQGLQPGECGSRGSFFRAGHASSIRSSEQQRTGLSGSGQPAP